MRRCKDRCGKAVSITLSAERVANLMRLDYIHMNPVVRRLVEDHPLEWPWSSARWLAETGVLEIDHVRLPSDRNSQI